MKTHYMINVCKQTFKGLTSASSSNDGKVMITIDQNYQKPTSNFEHDLHS